MLALEPGASAEGVAHDWHSPCALRGSPLQCPPTWLASKYLTLSATRRHAEARPDPLLGGRRSSAGLSREPLGGSRSRPQTLGGGRGVSAVGDLLGKAGTT